MLLSDEQGEIQEWKGREDLDLTQPRYRDMKDYKIQPLPAPHRHLVQVGAVIRHSSSRLWWNSISCCTDVVNFLNQENGYLSFRKQSVFWSSGHIDPKFCCTLLCPDSASRWLFGRGKN